MKIGKLAIHLIAENAQIDKVKASIYPEKFIELLVRVYNETKSEKGRVFSPINTPNWNRADHHDCSLKVYLSKSHVLSQAGQFVASLTNQPLNSYEDISHHFAFFVYFSVAKAQQKQMEKKTGKTWAIFVLTSNQAFRLVRPYCDYGFPTRIAFRLVKPQFLRKEISRLTGPKEAATSTYKDVFELDTHEYESLWVIYRNFDAKLRKKSSLSVLLGYDNLKQVAMHIGEGMIRIGESLELDQYLSILSLLLDIRRGNPTYNSDQTIETDNPSFEALENIQRVDSKKAKELDRSLVQLLWHAINQNTFATTLYLSHRRYRDYYQSTIFELKVTAQGSKRYVNWASRPTFHQLVEALRSIYEKSSLEEFENAISQAKFSSNGLGKQLRSLLEFIQGELVIGEDTYFRAGGVWLKAFGQHLATTEKAFRALISEILVRKTDTGKHVLSQPWISKEDWIAFSQLDIPKAVNPNDFKLIFSQIIKHTFQFIDSSGKVVVPYLTRAILHDQDLKTIK
nr:hypothetical protein [Rhabdochlamydiaceae bacterium]